MAADNQMDNLEKAASNLHKVNLVIYFQFFSNYGRIPLRDTSRGSQSNTNRVSQIFQRIFFLTDSIDFD